MPSPEEQNTVQARIRAFAEILSWPFGSSDEAGCYRRFDPAVRAKGRSLSFDDLLVDKDFEFNPDCRKKPGILLSRLGHYHGSINGNHDFAELLRNRGALDKHALQREHDLALFDGSKGERIALGNGGKREAPLSAQPKGRLKRCY